MKYSIAIMALIGSSNAVSLIKKPEAAPKAQTPDESRKSFEAHVEQADKVVSTQRSTEGSWLK